MTLTRLAPFLVLLIILQIILPIALAEEPFEPYVAVYGGRLPEYAAALASIIEETGTRAIVADTDSVLRGLAGLPQAKCILIAALNPSDFVFLREFSPALEQYFKEGGSFVGLGACCSMDLEPLAKTIFPIRGNATERGGRIGEDFGNQYVLSDPLEEISGGLPESMVITQEKLTYRAGKEGPIDPAVADGTLRVVYREVNTGAPLLVAYESEFGGRSVAFTGCYVVSVERLPFYWGNLVAKEEFRTLLRQSIIWAMEGSGRFADLHPSIEARLGEEVASLQDVAEAGEEARSRASRNRLLLVAGLWAVALVFQGFLVVKVILPRMRAPSVDG
jgi:hypothetical protein